jgi:hypothetical protein
MMTIIVIGIIIALLIADVFFVEFENFGWTTLSLIVTGVAVYYFNLGNIPQWMMLNGPLCIAFVIAYIVMGVIWSFAKWYSYLVSYRDKFIDIKDNLNKTTKALIESQWKWVQDFNITTLDNVLIQKENLPFNRTLDHDMIVKFNSNVPNGFTLNSNYESAKREYSTFYKPEVTSNKGKIVAWICYWPFSLIGTFINDPIRRLVNFLFTKLKATYQKMSDKVFQDFPDKNIF